MPGLVPGIHVLSYVCKDVDGRDKFTPGPARGLIRVPGRDKPKILRITISGSPARLMQRVPACAP